MYKIVKRCFDFIASIVLFAVLSPLFCILSFLVMCKLGRPIFFKQERTGKDGRLFSMVKFRTMTNKIDQEGRLLPDEMRFTKFGRWLRSSSLDELPELINIIRGDMSVIGPRPLPPAYNGFYTEYEMSRYKVRGGLIPPESLYFDSFVTWDKQLQYEADYANNVSLILDVKLLLSVFKTIFKRTETSYGDYVRDTLVVERTRNHENTIN